MYNKKEFIYLRDRLKKHDIEITSCTYVDGAIGSMLNKLDEYKAELDIYKLLDKNSENKLKGKQNDTSR